MERLLLPLGGLFILTSIVFVALNKRRRVIIMKRILLKRCKGSESTTHPRSLTPEKGRWRDITAPDYSATFPPSRRFALVDTGSGPMTEAALHSDWTDRMLPIDVSYLEAPIDRYTPCGFSVAEIKAIGDFPDYAAFSGLPLPKPYRGFNIERALPRPYRPFRWAYHQTMCTDSVFI